MRENQLKNPTLFFNYVIYLAMLYLKKKNIYIF